MGGCWVHRKVPYTILIIIIQTKIQQTKIDVFEKLRMIEIGPRGCWKRSSIFQASHPILAKCSQKLTNKGKRIQFVRSFTKKRIQKIEEMPDIFLNSANFASHAFFISASPSGYALNLKALIKVSKDNWTSQLSYEILRSSSERQHGKTNFEKYTSK